MSAASERHLARLIREGMQRANLSQLEFAARAGLSKQIVHQMLDDKRAPNLPRKKTLEGIAGALGIDLGVVFEAALRDSGYWVEPLDTDMPEGGRDLLAAAKAAPPEAVRQVTQLLRTMSTSPEPKKPRRS